MSLLRRNRLAQTSSAIRPVRLARPRNANWVPQSRPSVSRVSSGTRTRMLSYRRSPCALLHEERFVEFLVAIAHSFEAEILFHKLPSVASQLFTKSRLS